MVATRCTYSARSARRWAVSSLDPEVTLAMVKTDRDQWRARAEAAEKEEGRWQGIATHERASREAAEELVGVVAGALSAYGHSHVTCSIADVVKACPCPVQSNICDTGKALRRVEEWRAGRGA